MTFKTYFASLLLALIVLRIGFLLGAMQEKTGVYSQESVVATNPQISTPKSYMDGVADGAYYSALWEITMDFSLMGLSDKDSVTTAHECAGTRAEVLDFLSKNLGQEIDSEITLSVAMTAIMQERCKTLKGEFR